MLIGTEFGFSFFKDSVFTSFQDTAISKSNFMQVTDFIDCDSVIYILTYYENPQFISFNPRTGVFSYLPKDHRYHYHSHQTTCSFISSGNDTIIGDHILGVKFFTKDSIICNDNVGQVFDIAEDNDKNLWMASWNDGNIGNNKSKGGIYKVRNYKAEFYSDKLGVNSQECWCLYFDEEENVLWIGTMDKGIYQYSMSGIEYTSASDINPEKPLIHDIFKDSKENLWISAGNRIFKRDSVMSAISLTVIQKTYRDFIKRKYSFYTDPSGSFEKYNMLIRRGIYKDTNPYILKGKILPPGSLYKPEELSRLVKTGITDYYNFYEDSSGNLLIKTNAGISYLNSTKCIDLMAIDRGYPYFIEQDSIILVITYYMLSRYSIPGIRELDRFLLRKNASFASICKELEDNDIHWIYNNTDGLFKYQSGKLTRFSDLGKKADLSFSALTKDYLNNLIAGTNTGFIYFINVRNDSANVISQIGPQDGITGTDIRWVLTDRQNRLWFATNKGLNMVDLPEFYNNGKREVSFFNEENGFIDKLSFKAILDSAGNIFVISENNLIKINPDELVKNSGETNRLIIDNLEINYIKSQWPSEFKTDNRTGLPEGGFRLPYNKNTLTFYYHLLQYAEPAKAQYSYKLDGIMKEWTPFSAEPKAVFSYINNGRYTLRIRGRLISSPGNITEIEYPFRIMPPWWKSWWFISLASLAGFSIIYLVLKVRIRAIKRESETERKISELKMGALKAQMNPHFIFNAFNSIQKYILLQDTKASLDYMSEFALLIRQTLDNSSRNTITLSEEIRYLKTYLGLEGRRILNLTYLVETDSAIDTEEIFLPPMLIQPFVENSILHGIRHLEREGNLVIRFEIPEGDSCLYCLVEDNGIGRAKSKEINNATRRGHKSHGSQNTFQRMALFGIQSETIDLLDENGLPSGTKVQIKIEI
jgi:hypothetical protein